MLNSENNLRFIIDHSHDSVIVLDQEGKIIEWNNQAEYIFGWSYKEAIGKLFSNLILPHEYRELCPKGFEHFLADNTEPGLNKRVELIAHNKSGVLIPIELSISAQKLQDVYYYTVFVRDISERQEVEQRLKDSTNRLQAVFNTVLDGLITIDSHAIIQSFNASAERIFGYKAEEVIGQNVKMLMPEPYHSEHDGYVKNYLRTGEAKVIGTGREVTAKRKDGTTFPMELGVNEFSIGSERAFVGMIRDISERKAAEQALRESEEKLRAVVDNTVDGLITINERGLIETFNQACERIFGYKAEEVIGQNVKMLMPEPYHSEHDS